MASALGGQSILVITSIALFVKKGNDKNAILAMSASVIMWAVGHYVIEVEYPVILTILACIVAYFGSLPFTRSSMIGSKAGIEVELS